MNEYISVVSLVLNFAIGTFVGIVLSRIKNLEKAVDKIMMIILRETKNP